MNRRACAAGCRRDDAAGAPAAQRLETSLASDSEPSDDRSTWSTLDERSLWAIALAGAALMALVGVAVAVVPILGVAALVLMVARPLPFPPTTSRAMAIVAGATAVVVVIRPAAYPDAIAIGALLLEALLAIGLGRLSHGALARAAEEHRKLRRKTLALEERARLAGCRMRDFLASTDEICFETDERIRLRYLSEACERATGVPPHRLLDLDPLDLAERFLGRYGRLACCGASMRQRRIIRGLRFAFCDADGGRRFLRVDAVPRYGHYGRFIGYRGVLRVSGRRSPC
jgi:PAS domain-containing protein